MAKDSKELVKLSERNSGIVAAFQSVTDGVLDLAKTHLELAKAEARHDVRMFSKDAGIAAVGIGLALLGFGILNLAIIIWAGVAGGWLAAAITALVLGLLYTMGGLGAARGALERMQEREGALAQTKTEIKRSSEWVKGIKETS